MRASLKQIQKQFPIPKKIPCSIRIQNLRNMTTMNLAKRINNLINKEKFLFNTTEESKKFNETFAWTRSQLMAINENHTPILTRDCPYKYIAKRYTEDTDSSKSCELIEEAHEQFHNIVPMYNQNKEDLVELEKLYMDIMDENNELELANESLSYELALGKNVLQTFATEEIKELKSKAKRRCTMM